MKLNAMKIATKSDFGLQNPVLKGRIATLGQDLLGHALSASRTLGASGWNDPWT